MSFDPSKPADHSEIDAAELRNQFNALKALIDALVPVGSIMAWHKHFANTPPLPGVWAECNGQAINDAESPYNGLNVPDLNGAQGGVPVFLRGANASGGTGGNEAHSHGLPLNINGGTVGASTDVTVFPPGNYTSDPASSLPPYHEVVWVMRVK
jgi:hypothetical protein